MSVVRREYLHMAGEKIDQNKVALCVRAFRAGVVLALPSIWIVFLCGRFCTSFLRHFKQLGWLSFQIMTLFVGNCFLFWAKNFCIRSLCYRTNFVIPAQMYFYFVIFCIWHNHWNSLLFVLWHFVHAPWHCCYVFCIFGICVCIFVFFGQLTHLATVMIPDPSGVQTLSPATRLYLIEAVMLMLIRILIQILMLVKMCWL